MGLKKQSIAAVAIAVLVCLAAAGTFWSISVWDDEIAETDNSREFSGSNPEDYYCYYSEETGYYEGYLEDKNGRSFADVLQEGDLSLLVSGKTADEWISYVQHNIRYKPDDGDQYFTAEETLARGCGDCEDKAVVMAKGLKALGLDAGVALFTDHMVVLVSREDVDSGKISKTKKILFPVWKEYTYTDDSGREWVPIEPVYWVGVGVLKQPMNVIKTYYL